MHSLIYAFDATPTSTLCIVHCFSKPENTVCLACDEKCATVSRVGCELRAIRKFAGSSTPAHGSGLVVRRNRMSASGQC